MINKDKQADKDFLWSKVQMIFQSPDAALNPRHSIREILRNASKNPITDSEIMEILNSVECTDISLDQYPHQLSGGQKQRVCIARSLIPKPSVIICDEPTSALDVLIQDKIIKLLNKIQKKLNIAFLLITHDMKVVQKLAHDIAVIKDGKILEFGSTEQVLTTPATHYAKTLIERSQVFKNK